MQNAALESATNTSACFCKPPLKICVTTIAAGGRPVHVSGRLRASFEQKPSGSGSCPGRANNGTPCKMSRLSPRRILTHAFVNHSSNYSSQPSPRVGDLCTSPGACVQASSKKRRRGCMSPGRTDNLFKLTAVSPQTTLVIWSCARADARSDPDELLLLPQVPRSDPHQLLLGRLLDINPPPV